MPYLTLVKASPLNPSTGSRVDIYLAGASDRRVTGLNGQVWEPAMTVQPILSFQGFNGDFTAPIDPGEARFAFNMEVVKKTWPSADTYDWAGAPVTVYAEEPGTAWPWTTRFVGKVRGFGRKGQTITVNASVDVEPFTKDVLTAVYGGGGGAEGGADIKNRVKPLVLGWAMNVEPVLINSTNSVYQFSGYGAIEAVTTLYERGSAFSASVGDYANYTALVAASIAPGKWGTCLAEGMIRLGAPAYGVITGDVKGHKVGATTPRLTGAIINALATISGVSSGNIESSTITGLDTAVPYNINLVLTDQITFLDIARRLALPCNHQAGVSLTGKFFVSTPSFSVSETLTLNARGRALPQVVSSDQLEVSPPYYRTVMGANRAWRVHSQDEIAYAVPRTPRGDYSGATTYREGDIVTSPDGSTWIYINATPGAGNAPPTWPTTSNSYWDNMTGPSEVAYSAYLTNESATVSANPSGTVSSFTPASGSMILLEAGDPVASGVTYSVASSSNLTISINSSTGSYTVSAMSADTGTATLRATYSGKTFDKVYTLSKVKQGADGAAGATGATGAAGANAKTLTLISDRQTIYYDAAGIAVPSTQTTTFTTNKQNTTATVNWSLTDAAGVARTPVTSYLSASTGDSVTMTEAQFASARNGTSGVIVTASLTDGTTITDKISVVRVQQGATGANGTNGTNGTNGLNNATVFLYRRSATTPALPSTTSTYTFATGVLTGQNNSWTQAVPVGTDPLYVTVATASSTGTTDTIASGEWASPVILAQNGTNGTNGTPALSIVVTKKSVSLPAYANGDVTDFSPAVGQLTVYSGSTDVTASATLSATASGCTGTINTATNTPVSSQPKGYYRVTAMSADTATLTLTAVYSGQTLTEIVSLAKAKGGYEIVATLPTTNLFEGRVVYLSTDDKLYRYTGTAWISAVAAVDITGTITTTQITDDAITSPKIAANAVTATEIAANAVTATAIATDAVTANKIQAGAVTAAKISVTSLSAITADVGLLRTASSGARSEIEANQIRVYDSAGTMRVRIGVW